MLAPRIRDSTGNPRNPLPKVPGRFSPPQSSEKDKDKEGILEVFKRLQAGVVDQNPVVRPGPWRVVQGAAGVVETGVPQSNKCTGGDSCCTVENPCGEWEGDCDSDDECSGNLFCSRTCGASVASLGGDWDIGDDCCLDPIKNQDAAALNKVRFNKAKETPATKGNSSISPNWNFCGRLDPVQDQLSF